jgi:hypothetical protein
MPEARSTAFGPVVIIVAFFLSVFLPSCCSGRTKVVLDNVPDPGVTVRGEVPTPGEPVAADNVAPATDTRKEPRVVPFHRKPPPVELPAEERK